MATKQKNKNKKEVKKRITAKKEDKNIAVIKELKAELDTLKDKT